MDKETPLFPRTLEAGVSERDFRTQHELAHWTMSALESVLHAASDDRSHYSKALNEYNDVIGTTHVLVRQGTQQGYLTPELIEKE